MKQEISHFLVDDEAELQFKRSIKHRFKSQSGKTEGVSEEKSNLRVQPQVIGCWTEQCTQ